MKVVYYTGMENKERNNIIIKLSRRAKCSLTIVRADTVLPSASTSCFFHRRLWRSRYRWMTAELIILVLHWKTIFFF